jgi:hypothetical protein
MNPPAPDMKMLFLVSLPRSGSTLLQRLLAAHDDFATIGEPHVFYPYFWFTRPEPSWGNLMAGMRMILEQSRNVPGLKQNFFREWRAGMLRYFASTTPRPARWFIDKSPGYSQVVNSMVEAFPEDFFLVLLRNPLAVAASSFRFTMHGEQGLDARLDTRGFHENLYGCLDSLCRLRSRPPANVLFVNFETLLESPAATLMSICERLGVPFQKEIIHTFGSVKIDFGDPDRAKPDRQNLNPLMAGKWQAFYDNPVRQAWARRYLRWIGRERLMLLGYDYDRLRDELARQPCSLRHSLRDLCDLSRAWLAQTFEYELLRAKLRAHRRGHPSPNLTRNG